MANIVLVMISSASIRHNKDKHCEIIACISAYIGVCIAACDMVLHCVRKAARAGRHNIIIRMFTIAQNPHVSKGAHANAYTTVCT